MICNENMFTIFGKYCLVCKVPGTIPTTKGLIRMFYLRLHTHWKCFKGSKYWNVPWDSGDSALEPLSDVGETLYIYVCNLGSYLSTVGQTLEITRVFLALCCLLSGNIYTEEMLKKEMHTTASLQQCTTQQIHSRVNPELHYITKLVEHLEVWCTCCSSRWWTPW